MQLSPAVASALVVVSLSPGFLRQSAALVKVSQASWVEPGMVTETSLVAQLPSLVAVAALRSALPTGCREATLEAFVVGLVVDPADYDLVDHDRIANSAFARRRS